MIVVDSSALMAISLEEPEAENCRRALASSEKIAMSAATLVESSIVAAGRGVARRLARLLELIAPEVAPVTEASARRAVEAHRRWGRGNHPAALNFGDCFAYELATARDCPLLFIGDDFTRTDVKRAI